MKKILVFIIIAALVLAAFTMFAEKVRAQNSEITVLNNYSQYIAPSTSTLAVSPGDLIVVGELRNIGSNIVNNVTVQGTALSASGQTLAITSSQAFSYYMEPGQKAPFYLDFTAQSSSTQDLTWVSSVSHVLVTVTSIEHVNQRQYSDVNVEFNMNYTDNSGLYVVRGTIVNNGGLADESPWVVTTFYDASGTVVGLNFTNFLTTTLSPNGGVLFFATPSDNDTQVTGQITNYSFQVDSLTLTNSPYTPPPTSTPTGTTSSGGQIPILPIVIVVLLVVVVVTALILFRNYKRKSLPPPPQTE